MRYSLSIKIIFALFLSAKVCLGQGTRLLRQPNISDTHIAFTYGSDIWITELNSNQANRFNSAHRKPTIQMQTQQLIENHLHL